MFIVEGFIGLSNVAVIVVTAGTGRSGTETLITAGWLLHRPDAHSSVEKHSEVALQAPPSSTLKDVSKHRHVDSSHLLPA